MWFNTYPAMVFMGDVGALALGAALGIVAVIIRQELVLFIMGGVFVMKRCPSLFKLPPLSYAASVSSKWHPFIITLNSPVGLSRA